MATPETGEIHFSVVVPIFNEGANLRPLHRRLAAVLDALGRPYEMIFVDDGSSDDSVAVLRELQARDPHLRLILFRRNFGQHPAVMAGFNAVRGRVVITLDADLQSPPEEIPKLLPPLEQGYDLATGVRGRRDEPLLRRLGSAVANRMIARMTGVALTDYGCMLRAYRREVIEHLKRFPEQCKYIPALTSWLGIRIREVPVEQCPRAAGSSKYGYLKLIRMNFDLLTGFSSAPVLVVNGVGLALAALGIALGLCLLAWRLAYGTPGMGSIAFLAVLLLLAGVQLVALGLIGEYVARIFVQVQGRPYYLIKETIEAGPAAAAVASAGAGTAGAAGAATGPVPGAAAQP